MDYLLKPVSFEKFLASTNRVKKYFDLKNAKQHKQDDYFFINAAHKLHKIFYHDIIYLEGLKDYTKIHLASMASPLIILHNLKYFEDMLINHPFVRIHRSYIVSIRKITTVSRKCVVAGSFELPVSDSYRESLFAYIESHAK